MESVTEMKVPTSPSDVAPERENSTIVFPYTDLDNAAEVVRGIHHAGGTACDYDQLAAQLKVEAKGGGFRLRVNGAKTYGLINYERGGRLSLTELGRQLTDPHQERAVKMAAFLNVPLYIKVYEQFKGSPLPPQAGLERAIASMGVGPKVKEKARQVLLRSAKQAGFFDAAPDRLVKPSIRVEHQDQAADTNRRSEETRQQQNNSGSGLGTGGGNDGGGGNGEELHPLVRGLLMTLPQPSSDWSTQDRVNWLTMASSIFKMIYTDPSQGDIEIKLKGGQHAASA